MGENVVENSLVLGSALVLLLYSCVTLDNSLILSSVVKDDVNNNFFCLLYQEVVKRIILDIDMTL